MAAQGASAYLHRVATDRGRACSSSPIALIAEPSLPPLSATNLLGLVWLGLIGAAATYWFWLRGIARLGPGPVAMLGMLSPVTAVVLGWLWLGETLTAVQFVGAVIVFGSIWLGQVASRPSRLLPDRNTHVASVGRQMKRKSCPPQPISLTIIRYLPSALRGAFSIPQLESTLSQRLKPWSQKSPTGEPWQSCG